MAIKRVVDWKLTCGPEEADGRIRRAFAELKLDPEGPSGHISGRSKAAVLKNRWAAGVIVDIAPLGSGSMATCTVEMLGTKHFAVLGDLAELVGDGVFDDRGAAEAIERLGKVGRLFGRKEVRHLRNLLRATEVVLELGQGQYEGKQGLVVLTSERLFFFERSLGSETTEEFPLRAITSLSVKKARTGETLKIFASGNESEIKTMMHGQADAIIRRFHLHNESTSQAPVTVAAQIVDDPLAQLERLGQLREKGLVSDEEFEAKKTELLSRL